MVYSIQDTIVAIATPAGEGAIAIVRLSGPQAFAIIDSMFSKKISNKKSHTAHYGNIYDHNQQSIDSALLLVMRQPNSYTGEDSVEIHCHGSHIITKKILARVLQKGARLAHPGEFTYRAYIHKKLDLSQAEAVQDLICAQNELSSSFALQQLEGRLSKTISTFQHQLIDVSAVIEAYIDFPEEDLDPSLQKDLLKSLFSIIKNMQALADTYHDGKKIFHGLSLCIVGTPNVGKSSLLNVLLKKDRAIVTPIAGTTRDLLEETCQIGPLHFRLIDTAGIHQTSEMIEKEGIARSKKAMQEADYILLVLDASRKLTADDYALIASSPLNNTLIVWNKIDLQQPSDTLEQEHSVCISAKQEIGIEQLKKEMHTLIWKKGPPSKEEMILSNLRHKQALDKAIAYCQKANTAIQDNVPYELISEDLRLCLYELNTIIGIDLSENILTSIFSKFCIGK